jgi:dipeptidyl-peptidase 4
MADSFPRQQARTQRFTLGVPRSFQVSPDGSRVAFLRSKGGADPVTCLWVLDVGSGEEHLVADPAQLDAGGGELDPAERARRERSRERAGGIVSYAADAELRTVTFLLAGRVHVADLSTGQTRELPALAPAADPRLDSSGRLVGYVYDRAVRVVDVATGLDRAVAGPGETPRIAFGLAEFIAAEEMGRQRGYWWAPDGTALLTARVDESQVRRWHIADPAHPDRPPAEVRYPAAGTPNADVSLVLARLDGTLTPVEWDRAGFGYLVTACWEPPTADPPLIVVQSRDQRELRVLAVDTGTGATTVIRADSDPHWVDIVPGVPARTGDGRIVWTADADGARRLLVATAGELSAGSAVPVTPATLQLREVLGVDGDTVLFTASAAEPMDIGVWAAGPGGLTRVSPEHGVHSGRRAGGTTVVTGRTLAESAITVRVLRDGPAGPAEVALIPSLGEPPSLPPPRPVLAPAGSREIRTAVLLPSWHELGSAKLPVLCDPYGGPHAQRVVAAQDAFLIPQWFAEQGFAVLIADGRGTPGRGPAWDREVAGDLAGPPLADQVEALQAAAERCQELDLDRVAIRGWSFGGYLAALAVLRRPDVFHAAVAGAPVTDWRLYDTHYAERYLGHPAESGAAYEQSSLLADAHRLSRPLLLIHGLADDNVVVAHSLKLSAALLAAGRPHSLLPLSGVTHMASQQQIAENLLLFQVDFLRRALRLPPGREPDAAS